METPIITPGERGKMKREAEIRLLEEKILYTQKLREKKPSKAIDTIKEWSGVLLTIIGLLGAVVGLKKGYAEYQVYKKEEIEREESRLKFQYSDKMVPLIDKLDKDSLTDKTIMLLKYFGKDALPVLLFKLERYAPADSLKAQNLIDSIIEIVNDDNNSERVSHKIFNEAKNKFEIQSRINDPDNMNIESLKNYYRLLKHVEFKTRINKDSVAKYINECAGFAKAIKGSSARTVMDDFIVRTNSLAEN